MSHCKYVSWKGIFKRKLGRKFRQIESYHPGLIIKIDESNAVVRFCQQWMYILAVNYFRQTLHLRYLKGFCIHFWWCLDLTRIKNCIFFWDFIKVEWNCFMKMYEDRSRHSQIFFKICVLKNFVIFIGKHLYWSFFLIKLYTFMNATLLTRDTNTGAFQKILRNF